MSADLPCPRRNGVLVITRAIRIPSGAPCQAGIRVLGDTEFCMPWHTHRGVHEFVLGLRGRFQHRLGDQTFTQGPGQLVWVRDDAFHELRGSNCTWANIALHPKWVTALQTLFGPELRQMQSRPALVPERCWREVDAPGSDLQITWHSSPERVRRWVISMLEAIAAGQTGSAALEPWWFRNALHQIKAEPVENLSIERLCALSQRTREHVARAFRKHLDCTPSTYLNRLRLRHAAHLLETTLLTTSEIAFASGFESLNHFFKLFRQHYRCSPKEYRGAIPDAF